MKKENFYVQMGILASFAIILRNRHDQTGRITGQNVGHHLAKQVSNEIGTAAKICLSSKLN